MPCYHCHYPHADQNYPCPKCGGVGIPLKGSLVWQVFRGAWWLVKVPFRVMGWVLRLGR
jgi:hypothetical protein